MCYATDGQQDNDDRLRENQLFDEPRWKMGGRALMGVQKSGIRVCREGLRGLWLRTCCAVLW